jgi:thiol-disulfide isomerase/thioredoxin
MITVLMAKPLQLSSQNKSSPKIKNRISHQIRIEGTTSDLGKDTMILKLYPYYSYFRRDNDALNFTCPIKDNNFCFTPPKINKPFYVSLFLTSQDNTKNSINLFLIEPGDSIHMFVTRDSIQFSGIGFQKFICQYQIQRLPEISFTKSELIRFAGNMDGYKFNKYRELKSDSLYSLKAHILKSFETKLDKQVYERLNVDYLAEELFVQYKSIELSFHIKADSVIRNEQIFFFKEYELKKIPGDKSLSMFVESRSYSDYLMMKALASIIVQKYQAGKDLYHYSWSELLNYFQGKYTGALKDKLIAISAFAFYKSFDNENEKLMSEALHEVKDPYFKKILLTVQDLRTPGNSAFPFRLTDTDGNIIKLEDFKGKVLVVDFWFTGCTNCIALEKRMNVIRNKFQKNKQVKFLSVCLDKNKQTWIRSVKSGLYTGPGSINVYSNGKGFEDLFIKHYNIMGCPELIPHCSKNVYFQQISSIFRWAKY